MGLCDALLTAHRSDLAKGTRVLELGCGLGLPGMVCAIVGADVVLTDREEQSDPAVNSLELLERNIIKNFYGPANKPPGVGTGRVGLRPFTWDVEAAKALLEEQGEFDFVICSDCVYQP